MAGQAGLPRRSFLVGGIGAAVLLAGGAVTVRDHGRDLGDTGRQAVPGGTGQGAPVRLLDRDVAGAAGP